MGERHQPQGDQGAIGPADYSVVLRLPLWWRLVYGASLLLMAALLVAVLWAVCSMDRTFGDVGHDVGPSAGVLCPLAAMLVCFVVGVGLPCRPIRIGVDGDALRIRGILGPGPKTIPLTSIRWVRRVDSYTLEWPAPALDKSQWVIGAREWAYSATAQLPFPVPLFPHAYRRGAVLGLGATGTLFIEMPDPGAFVGALRSRGVRVLAGQPAQ